MTHSLTLGDLLLTRSFPDADHGYVFDVLAEGVGFGVAAGVQQVVTSLLADGDLVRIDRYGNREVTFAVEITGPSLSALAYGEAALRREVGRPNTLTWQAPDVLSVPTVFEVVTSEMQQTFDDLDEALRTRRTFKVTLTCAPSARSVERVVVPALESGTSSVTFDDCTTSTAWTGTRNGAPSPSDGPSTIWEAGSVGIMELSDTEGFPPEEWTMTRTGSVDFSTTPYLEVELTTLSAKAGAPLDVSAYLDGSSEALAVLQMRRLTDGSGYFRVTFNTRARHTRGGAPNPGPVASSITFKHTSAPGYGHAWQGLQVRNMARTDVAPNITARQLTRIIEVGGTERTPGSIHMSSGEPSTGLGLTVVHTSPVDGSGYSPPLRRWRVSGNGTPIGATDTLSGAYEAIHPDPWRAEVPNSALPPGAYALMAALKSDTAGTFSITWSSSTVAPFGTTGGFYGFTPVTFYAANAWHYVPLEIMTLPSVASTGNAKTAVQIEYQGANPPHIIIDEAWLFRVDDDCALTITSDTPQHLWLDSADTSSPVPRVRWSDTLSRTNQQHPGASLLAMGAHVLSPDGTTVFSASSNVPNAVVDAWFHRRWHSNAAE